VQDFAAGAFIFFACDTVGAKATATAATAIARTSFLIMFVILSGPPIKAGKIIAQLVGEKQAIAIDRQQLKKTCDLFATPNWYLADSSAK
jgi:Na+-driven multidrug efflux pump